MNTDDDVMWLREVLTGHDPADPGHSILASRRPQRNRRGRAQWAGAALAAAAVVAAIVIPVTLSQGAHTTAPATAHATSSAPAPRLRYDHLRWQDFDGNTLTTTTEWWWNGVSGRELKTDKTGNVVSDVTLALPPVADSSTAGGDPTGPEATPAPTRGVQMMADEFPGTVPTTAEQLRSYLQIKSSDAPEQVVQQISSLLIQRAVNTDQMKVLASMLTALPAPKPATEALAPDGRRVQVLHPPLNMGMDTETVLDQTGTSVLGTTWTSDGHTYWRLLSLAQISTTTQ